MLKGTVLKVCDLNNQQKEEMFELMHYHYDNYKKYNFEQDLSEKNDIVLQIAEDGTIKGFTTIKYIDLKVNEKNIKLLFSGDTIIHKDYWAKNDLIKTWFKYIIEKKDIFEMPFYWLLLSKGYKTYKYLPLFFKQYYPCYKEETPEFEQKLINEFARKYYPKEFNQEKGILEMNCKKDYLKDFAAQIPENMLLNKDVSFFLEKNPDFKKGNELVCCAKISDENLSKLARRILV